MKKHLFLFTALLSCLLLMTVLTLTSAAAGSAAVVFLRADGSGDGSSADSALSTLSAAYDALDLSRDCTIVLCGSYTQKANFSYGTEYTDSAAFPSVYEGADYRKERGAWNSASPCLHDKNAGRTLFLF